MEDKSKDNLCISDETARWVALCIVVRDPNPGSKRTMEHINNCPKCWGKVNDFIELEKAANEN
jgi:hypothetical protein